MCTATHARKRREPGCAAHDGWLWAEAGVLSGEEVSGVARIVEEKGAVEEVGDGGAQAAHDNSVPAQLEDDRQARGALNGHRGQAEHCSWGCIGGWELGVHSVGSWGFTGSWELGFTGGCSVACR